MLPYTPFTSESLNTASAAINDISSFADVAGSLPTGKQIIFFTIGIIALIASLALMIAALLGNEITPQNAAKAVKAVVAA